MSSALRVGGVALSVPTTVLVAETMGLLLTVGLDIG